MHLTPYQSARIVAAAKSYTHHPFDLETFNCVHFVRAVYDSVGITLPLIPSRGYPLADFHLSTEELNSMPIGHSVFLKRRSEVTARHWTHMALIYAPREFIHCSRYLGHGVNIVSFEQMFSVYSLTTKPS